MIKTPIQPIIHEQLTHILCADFQATPTQGAQLATKLIKALRQYDLDIIRGNWMAQDTEGSLTWEAIEQRALTRAGAYAEETKPQHALTWEALAKDAVAWIEGPRSPLRAPELR